MAEKPDLDSWSREALIGRVHILERERDFYRGMIEDYAPSAEVQERVVKHLLIQPDMLVKSPRAYEVLRHDVPVPADTWQAVQRNLCNTHGVMRLHKVNKYARYAGVISLDFERLISMRSGKYVFLTPSVIELAEMAAESACDSGEIDLKRPDLDEKYTWVSPYGRETEVHRPFKYGVTTEALQQLGLLAIHTSSEH